MQLSQRKPIPLQHEYSITESMHHIGTTPITTHHDAKTISQTLNQNHMATMYMPIRFSWCRAHPLQYYLPTTSHSHRPRTLAQTAHSCGAHCNTLTQLSRPASAALLNSFVVYSVSLSRTPSSPLWLCRCTATVWCLHNIVCICSILNSLSNSTVWPANPGSRSALFAQLIQVILHYISSIS